MDGGFPESQGPGGEYSGEDKRGFRGTSENAKTKICMRWRAGHCRFGDRCNFAHGEDELRKLPARGEGEASERGGGDYGGRGGYSQGYGPGGTGGRGNGGYNGYSYRGGYGGGAGYSNPGNMGGAQYRGGRGVSDAGQMSNQQNPLWAAQGFPISGPGGWTQYRAPDSGEPYYHNQRTGETTWDKPAGWGP